MGHGRYGPIRSHPRTSKDEVNTKGKTGQIKYGGSMANMQMWNKEIPAFSLPRLIDCPLQPGNLKISERACLKRYRVAQNRNIENRYGADIFSYFFNQGLLKCQRCPVAKTMVSKSYPAMSG
jgi:hypothetical protein